jgi:WhiB family redox-sensing transcriptional regulator
MANNIGQPFNLLAIHGKDWMDYSACKGKTQLMFPKEHKDITYIARARAICKACPVKKQCLEYALEFPPADMHGVWAGLTSRQLAAEQRKRGTKPTKPTLAQMWGSN